MIVFFSLCAFLVFLSCMPFVALVRCCHGGSGATTPSFFRHTTLTVRSSALPLGLALGFMLGFSEGAWLGEALGNNDGNELMDGMLLGFWLGCELVLGAEEGCLLGTLLLGTNEGCALAEGTTLVA